MEITAHALWILNNSSGIHTGDICLFRVSIVFKYFIIILNSPLQGKGLRSSRIVEGQLLSSWHGDIFNSYQGENIESEHFRLGASFRE